MLSPRLVTLIESQERRGLGVADDPVRLIRQWHTLDGTFVVEEFDPYMKRGENQ